jgi:hypothetical protein
VSSARIHAKLCVQELVSLLNGVEVPGFLTFRTFSMKVIGSIATVASSLPTGYQGVLLHIGGMIAYQLAAQFPRFELSEGSKKVAKAGLSEVPHCMATVEPTGELGVYSNHATIPVSAFRKRGSRSPLLAGTATGVRRLCVQSTCTLLLFRLARDESESMARSACSILALKRLTEAWPRALASLGALRTQA